MSSAAACIFSTILSSLNDRGFTNENLKANLVAFCSDSANTILGRKSEVATKLLENFPKFITWNCLNYDTISEIKQLSF